MNYNNKLLCGPSYEDSKPPGSIDYLGMYKLSAKHRQQILPGSYSYETCKNQALAKGKQIFGLSGFDPATQNAQCFIDPSNNLDKVLNNYVGADVFVGNDGQTYSGEAEVSAIYYIHEGRPWQCVNGVNIPIRVNDWDSIECMSSNGKDCVQSGTRDECAAKAANPVRPIKPIICSGDKYNDPTHWCGRVRDAFRPPPGSYVDPNVYGNAVVPSPRGLSGALAGILPAQPVLVKPRKTCCCPPPDPKIWMLRSDLQALLNRKIQYHPDYKILMDEYAVQNTNGDYAVCNAVPGQDQLVKDSNAWSNLDPAERKTARAIPQELKSKGGHYVPCKCSKIRAPHVAAVHKEKAPGPTPPRSGNCTGKSKCRTMCCPAPDPKKYILISEVEKILGRQRIQNHPEYPELMKTYASVNPYTKQYMACAKR